MFSINIPIIAVSFLTEGKYLRHLAALYIVTPEFATLFKCEIVVAGVTGKRNIILRDAKINATVRNHAIIRIKDFICGSFKIQQHNHFISITQAEVFIYCIQFHIFFLICSTDQVLLGNGCCCFIQFFYGRNGFVINLRIQIAPFQLFRCSMNIHIGKIGLFHIVFRFQINSQGICILIQTVI